MKVLAIDTATDDSAVALLVDGAGAERPVAWRSAFLETAPAAVELLRWAGMGWRDLDGIAVPAGPGSFTGLRVGAALALGIAELGGLPLFAPSTLAVVAEAAAPGGAGRVLATLDARRGRRYAAVLERKGPAWSVAAGPVDVEAGAAETWAPGLPHACLEAAGRKGTPAMALARLVAAAPEPYRLGSPSDLRIAYARPATESRAR
ncbi:MAG TPA: tRNA (adenosine(37)-N6)-threonylcarbamoyltransferase complex dimerization subunit type 1 TsaB [Gemmatimonadota bacterium]|nr:tRNA (adenosine(37)-N6)-threonylcarbamoyltransferase complex dimerization subunit type 1 TsaB [Gemmatimonadota bacterium]